MCAKGILLLFHLLFFSPKTKQKTKFVHQTILKNTCDIEFECLGHSLCWPKTEGERERERELRRKRQKLQRRMFFFSHTAEGEKGLEKSLQVKPSK